MAENKLHPSNCEQELAASQERVATLEAQAGEWQGTIDKLKSDLWDAQQVQINARIALVVRTAKAWFDNVDGLSGLAHAARNLTASDLAACAEDEGGPTGD